MFEDFFDWDWFLDWDVAGREEVKKKREKLEEARKEYTETKRKAREEEDRKRSKTGIAPRSLSLFPLSEEKFRAGIEKYAREHQDEEVKGYSIDHPNLMYRALSIKRVSTGGEK